MPPIRLILFMRRKTP